MQTTRKGLDLCDCVFLKRQTAFVFALLIECVYILNLGADAKVKQNMSQ